MLLRHPTPRDRAEYISLRDESTRFLLPWEPTPSALSGPLDPEELFERLLETHDRADAQRFLVIRRADNRIAGQVSINQIFRGPFQSGITGYWVGQPFSRQGIMSEALALMLDHAFGALLLHRIEANIIPRNQASQGLVKKLGFRFEGLAKRYLRIAGNWEDHEHWAILSDEWLAEGSARARVLPPPQGA